MKSHHYIGVAVAILVSLIVQRNGHALTAAEICANATSPYSTPMLLSTTNTLTLYVANPTASAKPENINSIIDDKGRYVLCWDSSKPITSPLVLEGTAQFPVTVYGLSVKPTDNISDPNSKTGVNLLTVAGPNFLFQNLSATNLRGPIVMNGAASILDSALSCDTSEGNVYANAILELKGSNEVVTKVTITNCRFGMGVVGERNIITDVKITYDKTQAASADDGLMGVSLGASNILKASSLGQTIISGYTTAIEMKSSVSEISRSRSINVLSNGAVKMNDFAELSGSSITGTIHVNGNNVLISKNTLGGDPAVQIAKGLTGVKVTQNNYATANTIAYLDPDDAKAHILFDKSWIGKQFSKEDSKIITRVLGKLTDSQNQSQLVEVSRLSDDGKELKYVGWCAVSLPIDDIDVQLVDEQGQKATHTITKSDPYFDCSFDPNINLQAVNTLRFETNTPTASIMSENVTLDQVGDIITVLITPGQVISGEGGGLVDDGDDAKIPDEVPMIGEGEVEGAGGSAMSGGATVIGGDAGPSAASPSIGGCGGQMMPGIPVQPSVMLWWLVPVVALWYRRRKV